MNFYSIIYLLSVVLSQIPQPDLEIVKHEQVVQEVSDSISTALISFTGDIMCHSTQFIYSKVGEDSFNFNPVFREIKEELQKPDLMIGNIETAFGGDKIKYSGYPLFNTPDAFLEALNNAGFDILITANNHLMDMEVAGASRSIEKIREYGMEVCGSASSQVDHDSIRVNDVNGIKIVLMAYTYGSNGASPSSREKFLISKINLHDIETDISRARLFKPDLIIVYFHFGDEYSREPNDYQKGIVEKTIEFGADVIIGSHPHVLQPVAFYKSASGNIDSALVAYSMGNFVSNQRWRYSDGGALLNIEITKNFTRDSLFIKSVNFTPFWVFKGITQNGREYIIYPSELSKYSNYPDFFTPEDEELMKTSFNDSKEILTKYSDKIKLNSLYHPDTLAEKQGSSN